MPVKKTYYPSKTFDDDFIAFVEMCVSHKWEFPGISLKSLQAAIKAQRSERSSHDALELQYFKEHESFGMAQAQRHALFSSALHAARGLFRDDKAVLAQLSRFTRVMGGRRRKPAGGEGSTSEQVAGQQPVAS